MQETRVKLVRHQSRATLHDIADRLAARRNGDLVSQATFAPPYVPLRMHTHGISRRAFRSMLLRSWQVEPAKNYLQRIHVELSVGENTEEFTQPKSS